MYLDIKNADYWKEVHEYVSEKHKNQMYGDRNYMYHINMVVGILAQHVSVEDTKGIELITGAYCHDLIEDQNVSTHELESKYSYHVAMLVDAVSGRGNTRAERTQDTIKKLLDFPEAINIKIVDRYCNMMCARIDGKEKLMKMYFKEVPLYEDVFKKAIPELQDLLAKELSEYRAVFENKSSFKIK